MKNYQKISIICFLVIFISGCAGQSPVVDQPVGISTNINGLQGSICNCGGVTSKKNINKNKKALKEKDKARAKADKDLK